MEWNNECSSVKILNPIRMEQYNFIQQTLTEIAEAGGGCVIDEQADSDSEYCSIYVEVRKTQIAGDALEKFKQALAMADTFILVPADNRAVVVSMSVFDVWQEIYTEE